MTKKEYNLKEKEVLKVHTNAITEITIKVNDQEVKRWQTRLAIRSTLLTIKQGIIPKIMRYVPHGTS